MHVSLSLLCSADVLCCDILTSTCVLEKSEHGFKRASPTDLPSPQRRPRVKCGSDYALSLATLGYA